MKSCPRCKLNYSDDTLEFCLEDGSRLNFIEENQTERPTVVRQLKSDPITEKTANLPFSNNAPDLDFKNKDKQLPQPPPQTEILKSETALKGARILEISTIVTALAHNWWQWIYLNNQYYYSFWSYTLSANFLMWLLLLAAGAALGLLSLKRSPDKGFAVVSLVILAVNLLLFLVPKR